MSVYDSAMASGACGPDPGRSDAAMAAAPTTPGKRTTAGGSSPKYLKRATRRELVGELGVTPTVSHEQLAAEVAELRDGFKKTTTVICLEHNPLGYLLLWTCQHLHAVIDFAKHCQL